MSVGYSIIAGAGCPFFYAFCLPCTLYSYEPPAYCKCAEIYAAPARRGLAACFGRG